MKARIEALRANGLLALCAALALLLVIELSMPVASGGTTGAGSGTAPVLPIARAASYHHPPFSAYEAVLERPLFFEDRRLPERDPVAAEPRKPLRLELVGTAMAGSMRTAMVKSLADGKMLSLREGDEHDGWRLESVTAASATFQRGEESSELPLNVEGARR